jgi:uncharacterized damage-inducible protein DinB
MDFDELLEAWRVNNEVNLELLALCADEDFELKPGKGKTIRSNFTHLIQVRRFWVEEKMSKEASSLPRPDWKTATREELAEGLSITHDAMAALFEKRAARTKPDRWPLLTFFAYCIAHEAHHRSQVEIALRIHGREPEDALLYRLWEWPKK